MEIKEALELLKIHNGKCSGCDKLCDDICKPAVELAMQALEKQIPKKPVFYDTKFRQRGKLYGEYVTMEEAYNCPCCNFTTWKFDKDEYCYHCGQRFDWSDAD